MKKWTALLLLVVFITSVSFDVVSTEAAIDLISFTAVADDAEGAILLEWETGTETNNAGFYLVRSTLENGTYTRINALIPSDSPDGTTGAYYYFYDETISTGVTYWYKLETIDTNGVSEFHGPASAMLEGDTPTPTASATNTQTGALTDTPTPTPTASETLVPGQNTPTVTSTTSAPKTSTPTATMIVVLTATATPTSLDSTTAVSVGETDTPAPTSEGGRPTSTITLMPLPTIELLFPVPSATASPVPTVTPTLSPTSQTPQPSQESLAVTQAKLSMRIKVLGGIVILLWLFLVVFVIVYFHQAGK